MTTLQAQLFTLLNEKEAEMIKIRRHLHRHPELSFQETETAKYIAAFYEGKDCVVKTQIGGQNGVLIDIKGGLPGPSLAIRADFDALPIKEATGLPFASENEGVMHACGHDGHTAYMMVLADCLIELKAQLPGSVRIIHQPAEEVPPGGSIGMIKAGCLEGIDNVFGIHVMSNMEVGTVGIHPGSVHTGRATFKVKLQGKGGHGSTPQDANDTIVAGAQFINAIQTIVSRRVSPFDSATVTIGSFDGKGSANVIKDSVTLEGDVRVMKEETRAVVEQQFKQILAGISDAFGLTYELDYANDYPVCVNDAEMTQLVTEAIRADNIPEVTRVFDCGPQTPSEDFAHYAEERPSCFFFVGAHTPGKPVYPHHHPHFDIDENCLLIAGKVMSSAVVHYLTEGGTHHE